MRCELRRPGRAALPPVLALAAQHVAVLGWGSLTMPELNATAEVLATTMTMVALLLVVRWSRDRMAGGQLTSAAARNLLALAVALVVVTGNMLVAVLNTSMLLWFRLS